MNLTKALKDMLSLLVVVAPEPWVWLVIGFAVCFLLMSSKTKKAVTEQREEQESIDFVCGFVPLLSVLFLALIFGSSMPIAVLVILRCWIGQQCKGRIRRVRYLSENKFMSSVIVCLVTKIRILMCMQRNCKVFNLFQKRLIVLETQLVQKLADKARL